MDDWTKDMSSPAHSVQHGRRGPLFSTVEALLRRLAPLGQELSPITEESLLLEDVGLDSLKFVDLTVGLEQALGIHEFPMQDWVDDLVANDRPMTVGALLEACTDVMRSQPS